MRGSGFVMKITSLEEHLQSGAPGPLNSNLIICPVSIYLGNFFKAYLRVKAGEVEVICHQKMLQ